MGRFLSGLSWSQPVAAQAYGIGLSLPAVQALVGSRDAQVVHVRLHRYVFSLEGVRVVVDSRARQILSGIFAPYFSSSSKMRRSQISFCMLVFSFSAACFNNSRCCLVPRMT